MATSIPPHNVAELCDAALHLIKTPNATIEKIAQLVPGPDFPTGGIIVDSRADILAAYKTGRGSFRVRARWSVEELQRGAWQVVVTEIPYWFRRAGLLEKLGDLIADKKLPLIGDLRDESAEDVRLVIEPKSRNIEPALADGIAVPDLRTRIPHSAEHECPVGRQGTRRPVFARRAARSGWIIARKSSSAAAISASARSRGGSRSWRGYLIAYLNIDEVIRIIREQDEPKPALMKRFKLTDIQAEAILNMRLRSLRKLEEFEIQTENDALKKEQAGLTKLLASDSQQWEKISGEIREVKEKFGKKTELGRRRTDFAEAPELDVELRAGNGRARADNDRLLREGLDPGAQGSSRRCLDPDLQGRRPGQVCSAGGDDRPHHGLCVLRHVFHA